jgi:hypothetical protein
LAIDPTDLKRVSIAAAIEFGRHRKAIFVSKESLTEMPEYCLVIDEKTDPSGWWVSVEPWKKEPTRMLVDRDPGDETDEYSS